MLRFISKPIRILTKLVLLAAFLFSITLNIAAFLGTALFTTFSSAFSSITGVVSMLDGHANELAKLNTELITERRLKRELQLETADLSENLATSRNANRQLSEQVGELGEELTENRRVLGQTRNELAETSADLAASRTVNRQLRAELSDASSELAVERIARRELREQMSEGLVEFRGSRMALRDAVASVADGVSDRAAKSAARETASMAGEALPYVGTAVIVGVTALEISDLCLTLKDMNELKRLWNPELQPSEDEQTVCSIRIPTREELWSATLSAPGAAWEFSKEAVPTVEELREIEFPSWRDVLTLWNGVKAGAQGGWNSTTDGTEAVWKWLTE